MSAQNLLISGQLAVGLGSGVGQDMERGEWAQTCNLKHKLPGLCHVLFTPFRLLLHPHSAACEIYVHIGDDAYLRQQTSHKKIRNKCQRHTNTGSCVAEC